MKHHFYSTFEGANFFVNNFFYGCLCMRCCFTNTKKSNINRGGLIFKILEIENEVLKILWCNSKN